MTITNLERAMRCQIRACSDDDTITNLVDFLADAMLLCRINGYDFEHLLESAIYHYQAETIEETGVQP